MSLEKLYTAQEAANEIRLSKRLLLEYTRKGYVSFVNMKGKYLYSESALTAFIDRRTFPARYAPPRAKALRASKTVTKQARAA